jgi:hypothetical protein
MTPLLLPTTQLEGTQWISVNKQQSRQTLYLHGQRKMVCKMRKENLLLNFLGHPPQNYIMVARESMKGIQNS